jgi:hypothetical protein
MNRMLKGLLEKGFVRNYCVPATYIVILWPETLHSWRHLQILSHTWNFYTSWLQLNNRLY